MKTLSSVLLFLSALLLGSTSVRAQQTSSNSTYSLQEGISRYQSYQQMTGPSSTFFYYCQAYVDAYGIVAELLATGADSDTLYANLDMGIAVARLLQYQYPEDSFPAFYFRGLADTFQILDQDLDAGMTVTP